MAFFILAVTLGFVVILDRLEWLAQLDQGLKQTPALDFNLRLRLTVMQPESLLLYSFDLKAALSPDEFEYNLLKAYGFVEVLIEHVWSTTYFSLWDWYLSSTGACSGHFSVEQVPLL